MVEEREMLQVANQNDKLKEATLLTEAESKARLYLLERRSGKCLWRFQKAVEKYNLSHTIRVYCLCPAQPCTVSAFAL